MATYVLVHGGDLSSDAYNKLAGKNEYPSGGRLGGKVWNSVVPAFKSANHRVFAPTLGDARSCTLSDHIEQICQLLVQNDLQKVILVGASYGGMVITGVANRMPERIHLLVYLDAVLPEAGQSMFEVFSLVGFDPKIAPGDVFKAYSEKLFFDPQKIRSISKVYVLCTESSFSLVTARAQALISLDKTHWKCLDIPASHVPQATHPELLKQLLLGLVP